MNILYKLLSTFANKYTQERIEKIISVVKDSKPEIYLDCGCGDGRVTKIIAQNAYAKETCGIEINEDYVSKAKKRGIKIYKADLNKPFKKFKRNSVDLITALETIEHLVDVDTFISEVCRILSPGGVLIITTENLASWHNIFALFLGKQPYTGPYISNKFPIGHRPHGYYWKDKSIVSPHLNVMTNLSLAELLKKYGFKVEKIYPVGFYPFPLLLSKIFCILDPKHSAYVVVKASKKNT